MRDIKFRAWWGKRLYFWEEICGMQLIQLEQNKEIVFMQYTGLKDKNGKEIYEGDILLNPLYEEPYVVEYLESVAGYVGWGDDRACGCYLISDEGVEIIGNIHENPELLK